MTAKRTALVLALVLALAAGAGCSGKRQHAAPEPAFEHVPAPAPAPVDHAAELSSLRVYFALGSARIDAAQTPVIDRAASLMQGAPFRVRLEGSCDQSGSRQTNLNLGARRAQAVRDAMAARGVDASRMEMLSYGKELSAGADPAQSRNVSFHPVR